MIKKIMLLALLCILSNLLNAQTFTLDVDAKLVNVNKSFVSSNVLYDRVFPASGLHIFTTLDTATYSTITDAVSELYRAQLSGNPDNLNPANGFKAQADSSYASGSVEIASVFYQYQTIHPNVLEYEPHIALFVADDDPLLFYKTIARLSQLKVNKEGAVYFEIHEELAIPVQEVLRQEGFSIIEIRKDMQGKDRMVKAAK